MKTFIIGRGEVDRIATLADGRVLVAVVASDLSTAPSIGQADIDFELVRDIIRVCTYSPGENERRARILEWCYEAIGTICAKASAAQAATAQTLPVAGGDMLQAGRR